MPTRIIIQAGQPITATQTLELLPIHSTGDPTACRRLIHPDTSIPPLVYAVGGRCHNPPQTLNLDLDVLLKRQTTVVRTLGSTRIVDYTDALEDAIVTEIWPGSDGAWSMSATMWRNLYNYYRNPPDPTVGNYVIWEPRDKTTKRFQVQIVSLTPNDFTIEEFLSRGGGVLQTVTGGLEPTSSGFISSEVRLEMRIVAEIA